MYNYLKYLFCLLLSLSSLSISSQKSIQKDSVLNILRNSKTDSSYVQALIWMGNYYSKVNTDSIKIFADSAWNYSKKKNYTKGLQLASNQLGAYYSRVSNYDKSIEYYKISLDFAKELKNEKEIARQLFSIANTYTYRSDQPNALKFHLEALSIREKIKDSIGIASSYNSIGYVYRSKKDLNKALSFYLKAKYLFEKFNNKINLASTYANIGGLYLELGNFDSATIYTENSLKIRLEIKDKKGLSHSYHDMGFICEIKKDFKAALDYFNKSLAIKEELGDKRGVSNTLNTIGGVYFGYKDYKKAKEYCEKSLALSTEIGVLEVMTESSFLLSQIYEKINNPVQALKTYKLYKRYADSTFNIAKMDDMTRRELEYDYDKKEAIAKSEQEKKNTIAATEKRKQTIITIIISIGLGITLLFALLILKSLQTNRRKSKIIIEQKAIVDHKQKEILDSISYAKRLQEAILPPPTLLNDIFKDNFILYKPKDIVAGDFYFIEQKNDHTFIAAADCTGHGVPGAMVSVVCSNALNRVIKEFDLSDSAKILDKTRELVLETFSKSIGDVKDGMDISFVSILKTTTGATINWSGANNPLWYIQNTDGLGKKLIEIKPDKQPIGKTDEAKPFTSHIIKLNKEDVIYLFTDGFVDQFGGQTNKKFKSKQLKALLSEIHSYNLPEQKIKLNDAFENWRGKYEQVDDICIIGIRI